MVVTPRNFAFDFIRMGRMETHFAMIGTAFTAGGYPLYYEAVNEDEFFVAG